MRTWTQSVGAGIALAAACLLAQTAQAQRLAGEELIEAIQDGGYYLVMRHATAAVPTGGGGRGGRGFGGGGGGRGFGGDDGPAPVREEELTPESIALLTGARHAFIAFDIPLDAIYTSPARRATQQAEELPFTEITEVPELDSGQRPDWLAARIQEPLEGGNVLIVSHFPIITGALDIANVGEGETLVVEPGGTIVGRLDLRDWSVLAVELTDF